LDNLEEYYTQKTVDFGTFLVRPSHFGLHPLRESACGLERASNDEYARQEKPEVSMVGRKRVRAVFAIVLRDDLDGYEDQFDQWVLEYLRPCTLVDVRLDIWMLTRSANVTYLEPGERTTFDDDTLLVLKGKFIKVFLPVGTFGADPFKKEEE